MHDHEHDDCACDDNTKTPITNAIVRKFPSLGILRAVKRTIESRIPGHTPPDTPPPAADTNPQP